MQIIVLNNQSLLDVAIRHCGTAEAVADIVIMNNISITDDLVPGQLIQLPVFDYGTKKNIIYLNDNKINPATAISTTDLESINPELGIGTMVIGSSFIVR